MSVDSRKRMALLDNRSPVWKLGKMGWIFVGEVRWSVIKWQHRFVPTKESSMKKILTVVLVIAIAASSVFAGDFSFLFTELDQHVEILSGFLPTLVTVGASYDALDLMPENLTQLQVTVGGGYTQRKVYQDPSDGAPLTKNFFVYDSIQTRWNLKFNQGLGESWVPGKDLVTLYAGYEGRWEKNVDSMVRGKMRYNGTEDITDPQEVKYAVPTFENWNVGGGVANSQVYPDLRGDAQILGTTFYGGVKFNGMEDSGPASDGISADLNFKWAPKGLSSDDINFYSATFNLVGSMTLLQIKSDGGDNLFSIVAIDRANVNWTDGTQVPVYAQGSVSLGRKVRGYNTYSFNTQFSVVNNFDIRLSGPDRIASFMKGVFPRINLFFDIGYHCGKYFNSEISGEHYLASTGAQITVSFMDFIDLGLMLSYTLGDTRNVVTPWKNLIMGATFFLDF